MKFFILLGLFSICLLAKSQDEIIHHRIVLTSDSGEIFNKKFIANEFGWSYFVCSFQYSTPLTNKEFDDFTARVNAFNTEIKVYKSDNNKGLVCIFPKSSVRGIGSFNDFINKNLPLHFFSNQTTSKITHVEVTREFDPLNLENEKGFNALY